MVGLLIGLIVAFLVDRRDKRIHNAVHAERVLDLPVLLNLPAGAFGREVSIASPRSKTGQAFTDLAHGVAAALGEGNHVVFVAGATPGPAGSVVAANLAVTLARTHSEVVLVCANMNSTVAPKLLGLGEGEGLAELIAGNATVRDVVQGPAGMPGLWVITPGADPSLAFYHLQHDTARALTSQLRRDARYVIIEAQAADDGADTFALGEFADAAVVTIEVDRSTKTDALECVRRSASSGRRCSAPRSCPRWAGALPSARRARGSRGPVGPRGAAGQHAARAPGGRASSPPFLACPRTCRTAETARRVPGTGTAAGQTAFQEPDPWQAGSQRGRRAGPQAGSPSRQGWQWWPAPRARPTSGSPAARHRRPARRQPPGPVPRRRGPRHR